MQVENTVREVVRRHFCCDARAIAPMGGGFYGRAFLAELPCAPFRVVIKLYLFPRIARGEARQLRALARYATLAMPEVYFVVEAGGAIAHDVLAMEFLPGVNAGTANLSGMPPETKRAIAGQIVENLLAYHDAVNPEGFGPLDAEAFAGDWREQYYPMAEGIIEKARKLHADGALPTDALRAMEEALARYADVFYLPIRTARLVHGDYNTWNVMLDEGLTRATAVIDPFNCCWADSEFDLYQLDNANGKEYGLLALYRERRPLSENFALKRRFYEVFTELNHYFDARVDLRNSAVPRQAGALLEEMRRAGIF